MKWKQTSLMAGLALAAVSAGMFSVTPHGGLLAPRAAEAQNLGQRVVVGRVINDSATPVAGATVFLKDLKTKSIRSYTSTAEGKFRFTQVDMVEDHELWAEKDGKKSAVKTVSSWDSRKEYDAELRMK